MVLVDEIRLAPDQPAQAAVLLALQALGLRADDAANAGVRKVSVDGRRGRPVLVYSVAVQLPDAKQEARFEKARAGKYKIRVESPRPFVVAHGAVPLPGPVVVCGMGPAGLFAALELAEQGYAPLVLERGPAMEQRVQAVDAFRTGGPLAEEANIQFGEGGAGTFSDGKLTTRIRDEFCGRVTQRLLEAGAPADIGLRAKPHIGTDKLRGLLTVLRAQLIAAGGRVLFDTKLTAIHTRNGRVEALGTTAGEVPCGVLVLACGHSARDTFSMLAQSGIPLEAKPFSVGVRIEHLQQDIDEGLYHEAAGHAALPPGEYQLSARCGDRGVYTFCMCPGGSVVAAASEAGGVVTNGMSLHARDGCNANAALVVGVTEEDFGGDALQAIAFQRGLEQTAYAAGGGDYAAPAETVGSFLNGEGSLRLGRVQPSYPRGVHAANLGTLLPAHLTLALRQGLRVFGRKLPGYDARDAVLTGLETRTSSPVRLGRGSHYESSALAGLWPCGEGPGYAGGIMSAAADGIRVAKAIVGRFAPAGGLRSKHLLPDAQECKP